MKLEDAIEMIMRNETPEQYEKRIRKIKRLVNERDALVDKIDVLGDDPRAEAAKKRLAKVIKEIAQLI